MKNGSSDTITLRGTLIPPVYPYNKVVYIRTECVRYHETVTNKALLSNYQIIELHWASLLEAQVDFTFEADPENPGQPARDTTGYLQLLGFQRVRDLNTAQLVEQKKLSPDELQQFKGLMQLQVLTSVPNILSNDSRNLINTQEIIMWADGSVTSIEYSKQSNGALDKGQMLSPLPDLEDLVPQGHDTTEDGLSPTEQHLRRIDHRNRIADFANLSKALANIRAHHSTGQHRGYEHRLNALLQPASAAANAAKNRLQEDLKNNILADGPRPRQE